jgi:2-C-methyl-D-erythritol 4-phosphate cytidylyltransferase/2-C-methyl-D-erythritol 2,4-cyclodiphosphate synthase
VPTPSADVVVVAAGGSARMNGRDKMMASIAGRPLLAWTLRAFERSAEIERIVVVTAPDRLDHVAGADWLPRGATVVAGGERRQESVAAGVAELEARGANRDRIVLVHDGARPAVRPGTIHAVVEAAGENGAAIPIVPIADTLKRIEGGRVGETVDRSTLGLAQTPQGVRLGLLREAWSRYPPSGPETFTDEASLLEACTIPVHVVPGQLDNLKVTWPVDLGRAAEALGVHRPRVGYAEDTHSFGPGEPLRLGGIEVAGAPRLHGHSDGDVVLHTVASALLGAAGLPDLGRQFPPDDRTPKGIDSAELLTEVVRRLRGAGFDAVRVDVTIVGGRPRLADRLDRIRDRVAELAGLSPDAVGVKASTGNLAGPEGAGRAISARAIATVEPEDDRAGESVRAAGTGTDGRAESDR